MAIRFQLFLIYHRLFFTILGQQYNPSKTDAKKKELQLKRTAYSSADDREPGHTRRVQMTQRRL